VHVGDRSGRVVFTQEGAPGVHVDR
jgi:hypothetical protein